MVVRELAKGTGHTAELVRVHQCIIWYCFVFCVYVIKARVKRLISYVPNLMLMSDNNRTPSLTLVPGLVRLDEFDPDLTQKSV